MKASLSCATLVALGSALFFSTTSTDAQAQAPRPSGTSVAVIDLQEVFNEHPRLKAQLEEIKTQMDGFEAFLRQEQQRIEAMAEQLKTLKPGTPDYAAREKDFASIQADIQVQVRQKNREFLEKEAQIRYQAYQDIQQHVAALSQQYGIQLVIRYSRQEIDASKPQEVQIGLNRPIVFQNSLDITDHVIQRLQAPPAVSRNPSAPATPGRTR